MEAIAVALITSATAIAVAWIGLRQGEAPSPGNESEAESLGWAELAQRYRDERDAAIEAHSGTRRALEDCLEAAVRGR